MKLKKILIIEFNQLGVRNYIYKNIEINKALKLNNRSYDIIIEDEYLGLIDWEVSQGNLLNKLVIYPHDKLDVTFGEIDILNKNKIDYEDGGLFQIIFNSEELIDQSLSEYQSFFLSSFIVNEEKIGGFVFDISGFDFDISERS